MTKKNIVYYYPPSVPHHLLDKLLWYPMCGLTSKITHHHKCIYTCEAVWKNAKLIQSLRKCSKRCNSLKKY